MEKVSVEIMASTISFGCSSSGLQMGLNHGSVVNHFHKHIEQRKEINKHDACLADLFITEPEEDLNMRRRTKGPRTPGTFNWFLESYELKSWFRQAKTASDIEQNVLWLHGNPGIGKSTMAMMLAEELPNKDYFSNSDSILSFFFCDSDSEYHRTATSLLRGFLYQIVKKYPCFMEQMMPRYKVQGKRLFMSFDGLWAVLMDIGRASHGIEIYCIADALDECDTESQDMFLRQIHQSFKQANENIAVPCSVHFLIISRPYPKIHSLLSIFRCVDLGSCKEIADDLRAMIQDKVQDLAKRNTYPVSVRQKVSKILEEKADGTFLWVGIVCRKLDDVRSKDVVEKLRAQPQGLYRLYRALLNAAFEDNDPHNDSKLKMLLMFVTFALRRLTVAEIAEACRLYLDEDIETRLRTVLAEARKLSQREFTIQKEHENFFQNTFGTWGCWLDNYNHAQRHPWDFLGPDISVIHVAARWGIVPLISTAHQKALEAKDDRGQSPLFIATKNTQVEALRVLGEYDVRFDSLDNKHQNVLHVACNNPRFNDCTMIKYFLDKGACPYTCDEENMTPFLYALGDRRKGIVQTFIQHAFNLESTVERRSWPGRPISKPQKLNIESGLTALHFSALNACTEMAAYLLECGANPNARSDFGDTALHLGIRGRLLGRENDDIWQGGQYAVESLADLIDDHEGSEASDIYRTISDTRVLIVETLLESKSINVNMANNHGDYPQHVIDFRQPQALSILEKLIEKGADASQPNHARQTCLHLASQAGNLEVIRKLVEEGYDIMLEDSNGRSPFNYAVSSGHLDTLYFMSRACDSVLSVTWNSLDHFGKSPLHHHVASDICSVEFVEFLIQLGCDVNLPDRDGKSALSLYMSSFHLSIQSKIFHFLVKNGADPLWINEQGQTLAHLTMHYQGEKTDVLSYLFDVGVDPATRDIDGKTLMHHGAIHGIFTENLVDFLAREGVLDVCATTTDLVGKTPLDYAEELAHRNLTREVYDDDDDDEGWEDLYRNERWGESLKNLNAALVSRPGEASR